MTAPGTTPRRRRLVVRALRALMWAAAAAVAYLLLAVVLALVPVNAGRVDPEEGVEIFVWCGNGVHTDVVLPIRHAVFDWRREFPAAHLASDTTWCTHIAFGWGDRGFYLDAREWSDLRLPTALTALSGLGRGAMHVTFCWEPLPEDPCVRRVVSEAEYRRLVAHVRAGFVRDQDRRPVWIPGAAYHGYDAFYEGRGSYSLLYTCNTWTNEALKDAGLPTAVWALFPFGIMWHL